MLLTNTKWCVRSVIRCVAGGLLLIATAGCDKPEQKSKIQEAETKQSEGEGTASPSDTAAAMAPEIANAVQEAAQQAKSAPGAGDKAPPPDGILGQERADQEAPVGSPPTLTLGGNGSEPRFQLGGPLPTSKAKGQIEISIRTGPQAAMPTVQFALQMKQDEPKGDDPLQTADAELLFSIEGVGLSPSQLGQLPKEAEAAIGKLKGSQVVFPLQAGAPVGSPRLERSKGTMDDLELMLMGTADALRSSLVSYPKEPVGKDAVWMVTSREVFMGADVVAYRLHRVLQVSEQSAVIQVDTKRYLAAPKLGLPGVGSQPVVQFVGSDEVKLRVVPGQALPVEGELVQRLGGVAQSQDPDRPLQVKMELRSSVAFPIAAGQANADPSVGKTQPARATAAPKAPAPPTP